jgi:hypothetical protein
MVFVKVTWCTDGITQKERRDAIEAVKCSTNAYDIVCDLQNENHRVVAVVIGGHSFLGVKNDLITLEMSGEEYQIYFSRD